VKQLMSGNEAIARGAWEAGCRVGSAYPGTPSTEILQFLSQYPEVNTEWSPNEKVALEVGAGAAMAGARALVAMKHVGVNVASDPLFTLSYTGIRGGLTVISADDPQMHSSQNEQDNRHYARAAKLPMLEPSDSEEARRMVKLAFALSEEYDCPVMLRTTTRISHGESLTETEPRQESPIEIKLEKNPAKWVMLPAYARGRHPLVEARMKKLAELAETFSENKIETGDPSLGIISSGAAYQYAREAFPNASFLKLGLAWPLPSELFRKFAKTVDKLYVVEELDPFIEDWVRGLGIAVTGKAVLPMIGEFTPAIVKKGIRGDLSQLPEVRLDPNLPPRPPILCAGCPHRGVFTVLRKLKVFVCGDIGCYTLAAPAPLSALDTCLCMGAGIGQSFGMEKALGEGGHRQVVSVIGDSTFFHSGVTPLMDLAYNQSRGLVIILDNRTTAMTGRQGNPGSGYNLREEPTPMVDVAKLAEAFGIKRVKVIDPYNLEQTEAVLREELAAEELSLVIARGPCMLIPAAKAVKKPALTVNLEHCTGCKTCLKVACPAISFVIEEGSYTTKDGKTKQRKGHSEIDPLSCTGCAVCEQVCPFESHRE
jgi:indolepyruvate ferredoxin oxidoreductase, alpha subunit